jgi:4'-phosphopantetheinyl transferase
VATLDLYWFALDVAPEAVAAMRSLLSEHERGRADRYVKPEHGLRYTVAHAQLRALLASRLGIAPQAVRYERGEHGKPRLPGTPLHFNLSHSGGYGLIGVHDRELGVDIEAERPHLNALGLAGRYFNAAETAWLRGLADHERPRGFSRLWTCKEAWMKADGRGLALPLRWLEVHLAAAPGADSARLLETEPPHRPWFARELELTPGYAAAVVEAEALPEIRVARLEPGFALAPAAPRSSVRLAAAAPPPSATA